MKWKWICLAALLAVVPACGSARAEEPSVDILLNQVGYLPGEAKLAVFRGEALGATFTVVNASTGETVLTGALGETRRAAAADETVAWADFSALTTPGRYALVSEQGIRSAEFAVGADARDALYADVFRMFYLQRCGCALESDLAGTWAHPVCHERPAHLYDSETTLEVPGGWHDAGDYGRYTVPAAKAVMDLIWTAELGSGADDLRIPESGNGVDDLLDEARYELDWLLTMQNAEGGVYHKVTGMNFCGNVWPQYELAQVICPVSVAATADFAGTLAKASTAYRDVDAAFADRCLVAARNAYAYAVAHADEPGFVNPKNVSTGEYGDGETRDERYFAAAQLYLATGEAGYLADLTDLAAESLPTGLGWGDMGDYGTLPLLQSERFRTDAPELYERLLRSVCFRADRLVKAAQTDGYFASIDTYRWGSNMNVANNGMFLLAVDRLAPDAGYVQAARDQLHYLLGRNATGYCFVTGHGTLHPEHPHHRVSVAAKKQAVPGMLVGGPNGDRQDVQAAIACKGFPPAKCYLDNWDSYSTNEIAIYWNSPLVYLLKALSAR